MGGSGACPTPEKFFLNGAFWCIFRSDFLFKKVLKTTIFYIKFFKIFSIEENFFLDTCLLWGNSHEEIFKNNLRLMRFGVYFERIYCIKRLFSCRNNYSCTPILWGSRA